MSRRPRGYTLAEMLAVCAVLSVAAAVAIPAAQPVAEFRLDAAAGEVVLALRFARDEAMRTGGWRMLRCEPAQNRVRLVALVPVGPVVFESLSPVIHPANRKAYAVQLDAAPAGGNMALTGCAFTFADGPASSAIAFDPEGKPVRGTGDEASRIQALASGAVRLGAGNVTRTITIDTTGRITKS